jgi:PKD repeat protein
MKKLKLQFNRYVLSPLLISLLILINLSAKGLVSSDFSDCVHPGHLDTKSECAPMIILDNGLMIHDPDYGYPEILTDSLRVWVGYEVIDSLINDCMNGFLVDITCFSVIEPDPGCEARFEGYPLDLYLDDAGNYVPGYAYSFIDVSEGTVSERYWEINGDYVGSSPQIEYVFEDSGSYAVCLTIVTEEGCQDTKCETWNIGIPESCQADFIYYPDDILMIAEEEEEGYIAGYPYHFVDSSLGNVIDWTWTIGNEVIGRISDMLYIFPEPGEYEVCLMISTADGCSSTACKLIIVEPYPECMAEFDYYAPLDVTNSSGDFPGSTFIQFVDESWGYITNWFWEFGDGHQSAEQNPVHEFPHPGEFEVCLRITTASGCEDIHCETVYIDTINTDCKAMFEYCSYSVSSTDSVFFDRYIIGFKNLSEPDFAYSSWDFGDGEWSDERNPLHIYDNAGIYQVCLTIYTPDGCADTYCQSIFVGVDSCIDGCADTYCQSIFVGVDSCIVNFTHEIVVPDCAGYAVGHLFSAVSPTAAHYYSWDFGDGTTSYGEEALHIYTNEGYYTVCLEASYDNGCTARECKTILNSWDMNDSIFYDKCTPQDIISLQDIKVTNAYPVPATDFLYLELYSESETAISLQLINALGQVSGIDKEYPVSSGNNILEITLDGVENGTYIYRLTSARGTAQGIVSVIR